MRTYIFIDNGATGSIGVYGEDACDFILTPVISCQDYTRSKKPIHRIDHEALKAYLASWKKKGDILVVMERPMTNNKFNVNAQFLAMRAYESTLIAVESLELPHMVVDSGKWQKAMLPADVKGSPALKRMSMQRGIELFPQFKDLIQEHGDADGILGAVYYYRERY